MNAKITPFAPRDVDRRRDEDRDMLPPLPEHVIEQLADLWCELLLADLERHPLEPPMRRAS